MIKNKKEYSLLLKSGMFWEFHPELTGQWDSDKYEIGVRKDLKEIIEYILNTDDKDIIHFYVDVFVNVLHDHIKQDSEKRIRSKILDVEQVQDGEDTVYVGILKGGGGFVITDKEHLELASNVSEFLKRLRK